ncbi:hypothetical protein IHE45_04G174700 [Dioscorea alata]|uniref:Uncharacterized protein n=1 Tax=Dioscorea alata TaxID=55571 RepID=A0ACB7WI39_DIOAL|nr:hypothetical protein IHE45_04G174700 [Dioscorea alata]
METGEATLHPLKKNLTCLTSDKVSLAAKVGSLGTRPLSTGNQKMEKVSWVHAQKKKHTTKKKRPSAGNQEKQEFTQMMILELGIWFIPFTLFFAPCRRFVLLVRRLQEIVESITSPEFLSPHVSMRVARLNTMVMTVF